MAYVVLSEVIRSRNIQTIDFKILLILLYFAWLAMIVVPTF